MRFVVTIADQALNAYAARLALMADGKGRSILAQALNSAAHAMRDETVAAETAQTGLKHDTVHRAQQEREASDGALAYTILSRGGNVRLKYFGPTEGGGGVTAHPWNRSTFYGRFFITSGPRGRRAPSPKLGGQVYEPVGRSWRGKIRSGKSGLFIPVEMTTGATAKAFESGSALIATRVVARLGALLP